jgi:hypothetical protein
MVENIDKLFDRDQKINLIAIKSNNLNQHSKNIHYVAAKIKKQEKMKQMKIFWMVSLTIAVNKIIIIGFPICSFDSILLK